MSHEDLILVELLQRCLDSVDERKECVTDGGDGSNLNNMHQNKDLMLTAHQHTHKHIHNFKDQWHKSTLKNRTNLTHPYKDTIVVR